MTRTKAKRLIDELIAKYGDIVVAKKYDYWASKTFVNEGEDTNTVLADIHLSEVELPQGRAAFEELENIAVGKIGIKYIPVMVPESKAIYDTPEQAEYRRIHAENNIRRIKRYTKYLIRMV